MFAPRKRVCQEPLNAFLMRSADPINLPDNEKMWEDGELGNPTEPG